VLLTVAVCFVVAGRWGLGPPPSGGAPAEIRIIQPDIQNLTVWDADLVDEGYERLLALSNEACDRPALLIWPESATWPKSWQTDARLQADLAALGRRGCPVLLNTDWSEGERTVNAALLVDGERVVGRYDKRHLVPFGEYVPFEGVLPFLDKLARAAGDFAAADEAGLVAWDREQLGPAICYEVIYPGSVAEQVRAGATVLVTVTNDAWYGDTTAPWQHLAAARWRAAENHRPMLRAAITGVSAVIGPDGKVRQQLGVDAEGVIATRVAGRTDVTPYSRAPWLVPGLSTLLALLAWLRPKPTR
jgi:apolipoprotein N-acyltransferase